MPGPIHLKRLRFVAGSKPGEGPLEFDVPTVAVLIGPNDAGKSQALREIETILESPEHPVRTVVADVEVALPPNVDLALELLRSFSQPISPDEGRRDDAIHLVQHIFREGHEKREDLTHEQYFRDAYSNGDRAYLRGYLPKWFTMRLDGASRFALIAPQPSGDLQERPRNILAALFKDDTARARVRRLTEEAFGLSFVIDPSELGQFKVRMSSRPPADIQEERGLDDRAIAFQKNATLISNLGDGVKAFTGLVAAIESLPHRVLLIDEPEAFLHPPLARRLGAALATIALDREASLVIATHSADVLLGCLETVPETAVIRLDYDRRTDVATAKALPAIEVARIAQHPLMRSADVLSALFHHGAVVCESDTDRVFYEEINRRLQEDDRATIDALFLSTLGRDSVDQVVGPLRQLGVPAAAIVDLDLITSASWFKVLRSCGISEDRCHQLDPVRISLGQAFAALPRPVGAKVPIKDLGLCVLSAADQGRAKALFDELQAFGLFVVPTGELESWLPSVGATGSKTKWVVDLFNRIGTSPADAHYLRAGNDDVWAFVEAINAWIGNPHRQGLP